MEKPAAKESGMYHVVVSRPRGNECDQCDERARTQHLKNSIQVFISSCVSVTWIELCVGSIVGATWRQTKARPGLDIKDPWGHAGRL